MGQCLGKDPAARDALSGQRTLVGVATNQSSVDKEVAKGEVAELKRQIKDVRLINENLKVENRELQRLVSDNTSSLHTPSTVKVKLACKDCEEKQNKYEVLRKQTEALKVQFTNIATGESHADHGENQVRSRNLAALRAIRDANKDTVLGQNWTGDKYDVWSGVFVEGDEVTKLDLQNLNITSLPEDIQGLHQLTDLLLNNNFLEELPKAIGNLKYLQNLLVENNKLQQLPMEIGQLSSLENLWLQQNMLKALPESIGQLRSLKRMLLSQNQLVGLPESISSLANMTSCWLEDNKLETLPATMAKLSMLVRLNLSNNELRDVPAELQAMPAFATSGATLITA